MGEQSGVLWETMSYLGEKLVIQRRERPILEREVLFLGESGIFGGESCCFVGERWQFGGGACIWGRKYPLSGAKRY